MSSVKSLLLLELLLVLSFYFSSKKNSICCCTDEENHPPLWWLIWWKINSRYLIFVTRKIQTGISKRIVMWCFYFFCAKNWAVNLGFRFSPHPLRAGCMHNLSHSLIRPFLWRLLFFIKFRSLPAYYLIELGADKCTSWMSNPMSNN